jgi:hypothetical protein
MYNARLKSLQEKHTSIDTQIEIEENRPYRNEVLIRMLKKQKLLLRDEIMEYDTLEAA